MDIFFCDACATRVTESDLKRGTGIRKGEVVVCGTCIGKGEGAALLADPPAAGVIDRARDRAVTQPDPEPVGDGPLPKVIPDTNALVRIGKQSGLFHEKPAVPADAPSDRESQEFAPHAASGGDLASAVNSFSALNPTAATVDDAADDVAEAPADEALAEDDDDAAADADDQPDEDADPEPQEAGDEASGGLEIADAPSASDLDEAALDAPGGKPAPSNVQTAEIPRQQQPDTTDKKGSASSSSSRQIARTPSGRSPSASSRKQAASSSGGAGKRSDRQAGKSSKGTSRREASAAASTSGKPSQRSSGRKHSKTKVRTFQILLGVTGVLAIVFVIMLFSLLDKKAQPREEIKVNITTELGKGIRDVKRLTDEALRSGDLAKLREAKNALRQENLERLYQEFETEAKKRNFTEEEGGRTLEKLGYWDLRTRVRTVNDEIEKLEARQH